VAIGVATGQLAIWMAVGWILTLVTAVQRRNCAKGPNQ
jgi:hypothetical protein